MRPSIRLSILSLLLVASAALAQDAPSPVLVAPGNPPELVRALEPIQSAARACIPEDDIRQWRLRITFEDRAVADVQSEVTPSGPRADVIARCLERVLLNARLAAREGRVSWSVTATRVHANLGAGGLGTRGVGRGGGGTGEGTIGLGNIGTIDHRTTMVGPGYGRGSAHRRRPRPARIGLSAPTIRGPLSAEIVRRIVRRHISELRYCYEQHLQREPGAEGKMTIRWIIAPSGTVQTAVVARAEPEDPDRRLEGCVVNRFRRFAFPADSGGVSVAQMDLSFHSPE